MALLTTGKTLKEILSDFEVSPQAADQKHIDDFLEKFSLGAEQAGLPNDFAAEQLSSIPKKYRRLKTTDPRTIYRDETEIFTPSALVDHLALMRYNRFNIFDLFDGDKGYTHLLIGDEDFIFALMRNMPISDLHSNEKRMKFEYRLAVWTNDGKLVGFRNHYVDPSSHISIHAVVPAVQGYKRPINVSFYGQSKDLGLGFKQQTNYGIWVNPDYRKKGIAATLENIASGFMPAELLGIALVLVYPGAKESKDFYWAVGYDEADNWTLRTSRSFPEVKVLPRNLPIVSEMLKASGQVLNQDYSPTWQYARLLSLEKRTV